MGLELSTDQLLVKTLYPHETYLQGIVLVYLASRKWDLVN